MSECVSKGRGFPLILKSLWLPKAMHAWIVNVCWKEWTVTKEKKICYSESMEFLKRKALGHPASEAETVP